jgi:hypothetical protein
MGKTSRSDRGGLAALTPFSPGLARMSRVSAQRGCRSADQKFQDRRAIDLNSETVEVSVGTPPTSAAACVSRKEADIEPGKYTMPAAPLISPRTPQWVSISAGLCRV